VEPFDAGFVALDPLAGSVLETEMKPLRTLDAGGGRKWSCSCLWSELGVRVTDGACLRGEVELSVPEEGVLPSCEAPETPESIVDTPE